VFHETQPLCHILTTQVGVILTQPLVLPSRTHKSCVNSTQVIVLLLHKWLCYFYIFLVLDVFFSFIVKSASYLDCRNRCVMMRATIFSVTIFFILLLQL